MANKKKYKEKRVEAFGSKMVSKEEKSVHKADKMSFKKRFASECAGEFSDSDYTFEWRGKKYNCRSSKKK